MTETNAKHYETMKEQALKIAKMCMKRLEEEEARQKWQEEHPAKNTEPMHTNYKRRGNWGGPRPGAGKPPKTPGATRHTLWATGEEWGQIREYMRLLRAENRQTQKALALSPVGMSKQARAGKED